MLALYHNLLPEDLVSRFLKHGARLDLKDAEGRTATDHALMNPERHDQRRQDPCYFGDIQFLLKKGGRGYATRRPSLHGAARCLNAKVVRVFIEIGADPNERDVMGNTPIQAAAESFNLAYFGDHVEMIEVRQVEHLQIEAVGAGRVPRPQRRRHLLRRAGRGRGA